MVTLLGLTNVALAQQVSPVFINQETGGQVQLVQAYWNANVDIGGREIKCDHFQFNQDSTTYEPLASYGSPWGFFLTDVAYLHQPIVNMPPYVSVVEHLAASYRNPAWSVRDGAYNGLAPFSYTPWVELVSFNNNTQQSIPSTADANAIRIWYSDEHVNTSIHSVCYALDSEPFIPTGSAEFGNADLIEPVEFTFQFPDAIDAEVELPVIYRKDTGARIEFVRGEWNYNEQLARGSLDCGPFRWAESEQRYIVTDRGGAGIAYLSNFYPHAGNGLVSVTTQKDDAVPPDTGSESIDDFRPSPRLSSDAEWLLELTDTGYNLWHPDSTEADYYMGCFVGGFAPKRLLPVQPENCDYTDAAEYDGWGWNSQAQIPCPPLEESLPTDTSETDSQTVSDSDNEESSTVEEPESNGDTISQSSVDNSDALDDQSSDNSVENSNQNLADDTSVTGGGAMGVLAIFVLFGFSIRRVVKPRW